MDLQQKINDLNDKYDKDELTYDEYMQEMESRVEHQQFQCVSSSTSDSYTHIHTLIFHLVCLLRRRRC